MGAAVVSEKTVVWFLGFTISSRNCEKSYVALIALLCRRAGCSFYVFWSVIFIFNLKKCTF
jgi:hypothetical protein